MATSDDEVSEPHDTRKMVCIVCSTAWVAIHPVGAEKLQCPDCCYMNPLPWEPPPQTGWRDSE